MCLLTVYLLELSSKSKDYQEKLQSRTHTEQVMFAICWEIDELNSLVESGRQVLVDIKTALDITSGSDADIQSANLPRRLSKLKTKMIDFAKCLSKFKRTPATHVFVIMVSSELRQRKPYALPVQCLPYCGLNEKDIRRIISNLINEMVKASMSVRSESLNHNT